MINKSILITITAYTFILLLLLPLLLMAQPGPPADGPINVNTRKEVIDSLSSVLADGYHDVSMAKKMIASIIMYHQAGKYDTLNSGRKFAAQLTKDLFEISDDKHISVEYVNKSRQHESEAEKADKIERDAEFRRDVNHGFDKVEILPGNVGLFELRAFLPVEESAAKIDAAMAFLADADALIIDLRYNRGGAAPTVQYMASYLLDSKPVLFNTMMWRSSAGNQPVDVTRKVTGPGLVYQSWTYHVLPGRRFNKKPVFILISEITASGAESFAYSLQALKRATIVGGTSAGAANPGGTDQLTSHFQVFIPRGKPVNPITHTNWEGTGVKPDIHSSFDSSVKVAYVHALQQMEKRGEYQGPYQLENLIEDTQRELADLTDK
jgi:C-terminal processing protease CtpA/Prc